jgi:putative ABC transport system permease protein
MSRIQGIWHRIRVLFRGARYLREQDDELRFHLELDAMHNSHDGVPRAEVEHVARRRIGNLSMLREELRRAAGFEPFDRLRQDVSYALRGLRRSPGFTIAVVATLGLGIGANAAMFSIVDRLLFRPPPMLRSAAATHRVYVGNTTRGQEFIGSGVTYARYVDLSNWTRSFSHLAQFTTSDLAVGVDAREMRVAGVSASFFDFFDASPVAGRYFGLAEDSPPSGTPVVVLGYGYWKADFGGRRDAIGSTIRIGALLYTIIGVSPAGFGGLWPDQPPVAYIPITNYQATQDFVRSSVQWWRAYNAAQAETIVQRAPGITVSAADADLSRAAARSYDAQLVQMPRSAPLALAKPRAFVGSILAERGPNESNLAKLATWIAGVALIVLLIACANVANLLLARALNRRREIAVRLALGVSRRRLVSQLLTESVLLASLGGLAGLIIAQAASTVLHAEFLPGSVAASITRDPRTLAFAAIGALAAGLVTGLAPALQLRHADLTRDLKSGAREGTYQRSRLRLGLLVLQGALSVILLVGAGLFVRSLINVRSVRLGYDVDPVLTVNLNMRGVVLDSSRSVQLRERLLAAAKGLPQVENASRQLSLPLWMKLRRSLHVEGIDSVNAIGDFNFNAVGPEYFATVGTRILRGRAITAEDHAGAPGAMVVSAAMAARLWPSADAIGKCVKIGADTASCTYVVGVAEDVKAQQLEGDPNYYYYLPISQFYPTSGGIFVRTRGPAVKLADEVRRRLQPEMPGASYLTTTPFDEILGSRTRSWKLGANLFLAFGLLAFVLATLGVFSVIAYNAAQRTREFGVRLALGAEARDVAALMIGQGLRVTAAGLAIGAVVALCAGRFVKPLLFDESPKDPVVFAIVAGSLFIAAVLASLIPALRATRVDPVQALRSD